MNSLFAERIKVTVSEQLNSDRGEERTEADIVVFDRTAREKDQRRRETLLHDEATASSGAGRRRGRSVLLLVLFNEFYNSADIKAI